MMLRAAGRRAAALARSQVRRDVCDQQRAVVAAACCVAGQGGRRVLRPGGRLVLGVHERAVLPGDGTAGHRFDDVLWPALQAAGFAAADANCRPTQGGQAVVCHALRPASP